MDQKISQKSHILHLPKWYPHPADIQNGVFIKKHIEVVAEKFNCTVVFVTSAKQKKCYHIEKQFDQGVFTVRIYFREFEHLNIIKPCIHAFRYFVALRKGVNLTVQKFGKPSLIHAHVILRTALIAWFFAIYYKIPFIISEHWSGFINGNFQKKTFIYRKLSLFAMKKAEKIVVVSMILKNGLSKTGVKESKILIVPNIVDALPQHQNRQVRVKNGKVIFVSVADLVDEIKNIGDVVGVVADLAKDYPIEYWIVGDGKDKDLLIIMARMHDVFNKQVFFLGRKTNEEVLKILSEVDFLVLNSYIETFSVVTAEALLAGKPVIATRCGGPEAFVNESNGILIEPGSSADLNRAIIEMIAKYKTYDPKILKGAIIGEFGYEAVRNKITDIYDEIIN